MIRIGTAGIPICCERKDTVSGIREVRRLGLDAMEIEFVRRVYLSEASAKAAGEVAKQLDVELSVHAPYFINLCSKEEEKRRASEQRIIASAKIGAAAMATIVVFHPGFYSNLSPERAYGLVRESLERIVEEVPEHILLGPETMGKQQQFGSLEEVLRLCSEVDGAHPVLDFAHLHARSDGDLKRKEDFIRVFEEVEKQLGSLSYYHIHITGVEHKAGNEKRHLTLEEGEPDFKLLAEVLVELGVNAVVISESPTIEQDALVFKGMLEGVRASRKSPNQPS